MAKKVVIKEIRAYIGDELRSALASSSQSAYSLGIRTGLGEAIIELMLLDKMSVGYREARLIADILKVTLAELTGFIFEVPLSEIIKEQIE